MTKQLWRILLLVSLILTIVSAINIEKYLYPDESSNDISFETLEISNNMYQLVFIKGKAAFLLENGAPITNHSRVYQLLNDYANHHFVISTDKLNEMLRLVDLFNKSRNDGEDAWKGSGLEEYTCRQCLFLDKFKCVDQESCYNLSKILCSYYGVYIGCNDPSDIYDEVVKFSTATFAVDNLLTQLVDHINELKTNVSYDIIEEIGGEIDEIDEYSKDIEDTIFRMPHPEESCDDCYGICPPLHLNSSALDELASLAKNLKSIADEKKTYLSYAASINNETDARLSYYATKTKQAGWQDQLEPIKERRTKLFAAYSNLSVITDDELEMLFSSLDECISMVEGNISIANFTNLQSMLKDCSEIEDEIENKTTYLSELLENVTKLRKSVFVGYYKLAAVFTSPEQTIVLNTISKRIEDANKLTNGSALEWETQLATYREILLQEEMEIAKIKASYTASPIDVFFLNIIKSFRSILLSGNGLLPTSFTSFFLNNVPLISSVLIFFFFILPLLSIALLWARGTSSIITIPLVIIIVFLAIVLPILNYLQLSSYPQHMNIFLFSALLPSQPTTDIWVDVTGDDGGKILSCAQTLASALEKQGMKAKIYLVNGTTCEDILGNPITCTPTEGTFYFSSGKSLSITYSGPYVLKASVVAPEDFYETCLIKDVLLELQ